MKAQQKPGPKSKGKGLKKIRGDLKKSANGAQRRSKRRRQRNIQEATKKWSETDEVLRLHSYRIIPKGKRLAHKVVGKLEDENVKYALARAVDAAKRLQKSQKIAPQDEDEEIIAWKKEQKKSKAYKTWKQKKTERLIQREAKRRKRREETVNEELRRKKYRIHPHDQYHIYLEGYEKKRHRISKKRFMRCVDVPLFKEVLNVNKELLNSPIWDSDLSLSSLTFARARILKDHLQQFEVLEEALKQGIFDKPGCDELPIHQIRRKRGRRGKKPEDGKVLNPKSASEGTIKQKFRDKYKPRDSKMKRSEIKREEVASRMFGEKEKPRLNFPPYEDEPQLPSESMGWLDKIESWVVNQAPKDDAADASKSLPEPLEPVVEERQSTISLKLPEEETGDKVSEKVAKVVNEWLTTRRKSVTIKDEVQAVPPEVPPESSALEGAETSFNPETTNADPAKAIEITIDDELPSTAPEAVTQRLKPYSNLLTLKVPLDLGRRQKFITNLIEKRIKTPKKVNPAWLQKKKDEPNNERPEQYDPLQKLHPDDKDSDIWTITTTTTTDSYASWRPPPAEPRVDEEEDWTVTDKTFLWRIVLLIIVIWEANCFVDAQIESVYYNIYTSHLYRENIWAVRPGLMPPLDHNFIIHVQKWVHFFVSVISMAIIHKENECLSLLFASSLLWDGTLRVAIASHDTVFIPHPLSWGSILLSTLHLMWKSFVICFFVAYHFYGADYIRKSRECKHRKTKLHNHEINAKGTKGLQKRKLAWDWMTLHARRTNINALRKKYPNIKDGDFPSENFDKDVKFDERKELRCYAQENNFNLGYPYNKLRDMKRHVFGDLERSEYSTDDNGDNNGDKNGDLNDPDDIATAKQYTSGKRQGTAGKGKQRKEYEGLTMDKWDKWREKERQKEERVRSSKGSISEREDYFARVSQVKEIPQKEAPLTISNKYTGKHSIQPIGLTLGK